MDIEPWTASGSVDLTTAGATNYDATEVTGGAAKGYEIPDGVTDVRAMQQALGVKADGVWGEKTEAAWTNAMNGGGIVAGASHTREDADKGKEGAHAWQGTPEQKRNVNGLIQLLNRSNDLNKEDKAFLSGELSQLQGGGSGEHLETLYSLSMRYGVEEVWNSNQGMQTLYKAYENEEKALLQERRDAGLDIGKRGRLNNEIKEARKAKEYIGARVSDKMVVDLNTPNPTPEATATPYPEATAKPTAEPTPSPTPEFTFEPAPLNVFDSEYNGDYSRLDEPTKKLLATVAGEALSEDNLEWRACAAVMLNRVGKHEWSRKNLIQVLIPEHFTGIESDQYSQAEKYMKGESTTWNSNDIAIFKKLTNEVLALKNGYVKDPTGGAVYFAKGESPYGGEEKKMDGKRYHRFFMHKKANEEE